MYLYPENLTARPMLWLWTLRDVAFIGVGLCIRHGGVSMLDFLRYATAFFFFGQQYYEWRE